MNMKCSICNKEANYMVVVSKNDKQVDYYEARCKTHLNLGIKKERELKNEKRKKRFPEGTEVW